MSNNEIKLSAVGSSNLTESASDAEATVGNKTVATASSTQSKEAILTSGGLKTVSSDLTAKDGSRVSVHDVAAYILRRQGEMTAMKLQKLVYYSQAWSLVWDDAPLFDEPIEAWANGPVVRSLYNRHQGMFKVREWNGDPKRLSAIQQETVEKVLEFYGPMSSQALSDLTHQEAPWREARRGLGPSDRGAREITLASMAEYYSSLK